MQMSCNNRNNNKEELKETENHSIKKEIFMRCLLPLRNKEKNKNMQAVAQLNTCNSNYYSTDIAVSLDDKYVGVVIGQNNNKIVVLSEECEAHNR